MTEFRYEAESSIDPDKIELGPLEGVTLESLKDEIEELKAQLAQPTSFRDFPGAQLRDDLEPGQTIAADGKLRLVYQPDWMVPVDTDLRGHLGKISARTDTPYLVVEKDGRVQANCHTEAKGRFWLKRLAAR